MNQHNESAWDDEDIRLVDMPASLPVERPPTVDELIDEYDRHATAEQAARLAKLAVVAQLANMAPMVDGCRTTRLRGHNRRVKIEWPDNSWDQSRLKEAWHAYPKLRDELLSISSLRVKLRE